MSAEQFEDRKRKGIDRFVSCVLPFSLVGALLTLCGLYSLLYVLDFGVVNPDVPRALDVEVLYTIIPGLLALPAGLITLALGVFLLRGSPARALVGALGSLLLGLLGLAYLLVFGAYTRGYVNTPLAVLSIVLSIAGLISLFRLYRLRRASR